MYLRYDIQIHTYKHTYIQAPIGVRSGSSQLPLDFFQGSGTKSLHTVLDQTIRKAGPLLIEAAMLLTCPPSYCLISPSHPLHQELYVTKM